MSMVLFFSPMALSPEIRNRIYRFSISLEQGCPINYKMYLLMSSEILQKGCSFGFLANTATAVLLQMPYIIAVDQEDLLKASSLYM